MNILKLFVLYLMIFLNIVGCKEVDSMILEYEDIQFFKSELITNKNGENLVRISGLSFHSSMAVKNISSYTEGSSVIVLIHLTPTKQGLSGSFQHDIELSNTISSIKLGTKKHIIWER